MIAMSNRGMGMTSVRWLSFALVTALLLSTSARAGVFDTPMSDPGVCGDTDVVTGFSDVSVFIGSPHCDSLCKKAEAECRKFTRKVFGCFQSWFKDSAGFVLRNCGELEPSSVANACKESTKNDLRTVKTALAGALDSSLADCSLWGAMCRSECLGSM